MWKSSWNKWLRETNQKVITDASGHEISNDKISTLDLGNVDIGAPSDGIALLWEILFIAF